MAIYHLSSGFVSRTTGRSAVQSAAYITGEKLFETRREMYADYQNRRHDIAFTATLIPDHIPSDLRETFNTLTVWDRFESFEDAYAIKRFPHNLEAREKYLTSAQTAMTLVVALPRELSMDASRELVEAFAQTRFVSRGLITTVALHDDEGNPHAHLQIARRAVDEHGTLAWAKDRAICTRSELLVTRKLWADLANHYLEREGFEARITEKSFADLGVHLEPTQHRGWYADKLQRELHLPSRIGQENEKTFEENRQRLCENPAFILDELTSTQATFTQLQLLKNLQKRIGDEAPLVAALFEQALHAAVVVGEGMDGHVRYTSASYQAIEEKACAQLEELLKDQGKPRHTIKPGDVQTLIHNHYAYLSAEQQHAVWGLTQEKDQLAVMIGRAGAGKTTTLKAVAEVYQNAGYQLIGTSLSALAAENLENETGVASSTLHSLLYRWDRYQQAKAQFLSFDAIMEEGAFKQLQWYQDLKRFESTKLTDKHVLIVDEAGMIGTQKWQELLTHVQREGAKVIAVGDDHQFKAIEAGDFFRDMVTCAEDKKKLYTLETIRRQRVDWMGEASKALAELHTQQGLSLYEQHGHVHQTDRVSLEGEIAKAYVARVAHTQNGLVLAFTNAQTRALNQAIRAELQAHEKLSKDPLLTIKNQPFAKGDKVVFLQNKKQDVVILDDRDKPVPGAFIKNGTTGLLESVNHKGEVTIRLSDNQKAVFHKEAYGAIDYGYALTTHKSQGQTVDFTLIAASKNMDAKGLYVAMTRHRHDAQLYYAKEDFGSFKALASHLSRFEGKDLVKDYTIRPENEAAWQRVQEYRLCVLDAAAVLKDGSDKSIDWEAYRGIKQQQIELGKDILSAFKTHQLYLEQAGFTHEMLQITTGLKPRPLSLGEEKAKLTVEIYGEMAQLARSLWSELNGQSLATNAKNLSLEQYVQTHAQFQELRAERDGLAHEILGNYPLHRPFVQALFKTYGITKKTLENQVAYRDRQHEKHAEKAHAQESSLENSIIHSKNIYSKIDKNSAEIDLKYKLNNSNYVKYRHNNDQDGVKNNPRYVNSSNEKSSASHRSPQDHAPRRNTSEVPQPFTPSAADINASLNRKIKDLAFHFLGKPSKHTSREWRYGAKGSLAIQVAGTKQGLYSNFETGTAGSAITFIADQLGISHKEAFKWGINFLEGAHDHALTTPASKHFLAAQKHHAASHTLKDKSVWTPLYPVKAEHANPTLNRESQLSYMMRGRREVARFAYLDADKNLLGYVVRLEDKDGGKITPTLTYCRNDKGVEVWRFQGFSSGQQGDKSGRPLYGLDLLKERPTAPVLVVEGEKTAEAARGIFKEHVVVTWPGGCGAVNKADWSVLKGREVTLWPDHDKPGRMAAEKMAGILFAQNTKEDLAIQAPQATIKIVNLPSSLPHKWDLADPIPEGFAVENFYALVHGAPLFENDTLKDRESSALGLINQDITHKTLGNSQRTDAKEFSYKEIYELSHKHHLGYLVKEERVPLITYIATETYKELKQWHILGGKSYDEAKLQEQAALTGVFTARAKALLETFKHETRPLEKALSVGAIAAKLQMDGVNTRVGSDRAILVEAIQKHEEIESTLQKTLQAPSSLLHNCSKQAQEAIIRSSSRCRAMTGHFIPLETTKELIQTVETTCKDTDMHAIRGVIDLFYTSKSSSRPLEKLNTITEQMGYQHSIKKNERLENAIHQVHTQTLQKEKDLSPLTQHQRSFER